MGYRLEAGESVKKKLERVAREQLESALDELSEEAPDRAVHQVRKRLKKIRGLLRLVRPDFPAYSKENAFLRDCAARLAPLRDAKATLVTLQDLRHDGVEDDAFQRAEAALVLHKQHIEREHPYRDVFELVRSDLRAFEKHISDWKLEESGAHAVVAGLEKTYERGRKALRRAYAKPSGENFHDWRKRVKYHWYHMRLLECVWEPIMKARIQELDELSDLLGDAHDRVVLESLLASDSVDLDKKARKTLAGICQASRRKLEQSARPLGERLYAESAQALAHRFHRYFHTWHGTD